MPQEKYRTTCTGPTSSEHNSLESLWSSSLSTSDVGAFVFSEDTFLQGPGWSLEERDALKQGPNKYRDPHNEDPGSHNNNLLRCQRGFPTIRFKMQ